MTAGLSLDYEQCEKSSSTVASPFPILKTSEFIFSSNMLINRFFAEVCLPICWPSARGAVVFPEQEVPFGCVEIKQHLLSWHGLTWFWGRSSAGSQTDTVEKRLRTIKCFSFHLLWHWMHDDCEAGEATPELPCCPELYHREEKEKTNCNLGQLKGQVRVTRWNESTWVSANVGRLKCDWQDLKTMMATTVILVKWSSILDIRWAWVSLSAFDVHSSEFKTCP